MGLRHAGGGRMARQRRGGMQQVTQVGSDQCCQFRACWSVVTGAGRGEQWVQCGGTGHGVEAERRPSEGALAQAVCGKDRVRSSGPGVRWELLEAELSHVDCL